MQKTTLLARRGEKKVDEEDEGDGRRSFSHFAGNRCGLRGRTLCDSCMAEDLYHVPLTACRAAFSLAPRACWRGRRAIDSPARAQPAERKVCCRSLHAPLLQTLLFRIPLQMYGKVGCVKLGERKRRCRVAT